MDETLEIAVTADPYAIISFAGYLLVILLIGLASVHFSSKGINEFFLGGRRMNRFVVALSAVVSGRSAWLLLGVSGMAYVRGVSAIWACVGYIAVELALFIFVAPRLRIQTQELDAVTIPDYLELRLKDSSHLIRIVSVLIIVIFMMAYVAAQFKAGGKAFFAGFGMDPTCGLLLTAGIVLIYTFLGGFLAVSLTDMVQAVFMLIALVVLPAVAIIHFGGLSFVIDALNRYQPSHFDLMALGFGVWLGYMGIGLGSPGNPHILVRYMSIDDPKHLKVSAVIATLWNIILALGAVAVGVVGKAYFPVVDNLPNGDAEAVFPILAQHHLHPVLFGLVTAAIFAAIMSTADSQILVASSSLVRDIYQKFLKKNQSIPQNTLVKLSRWMILFVVGGAVMLGYTASEWVFWLVLFAWAGLGASFGPTIFLALFWKRTTKWGVLAGLISGTLVTIFWKSSELLTDIVYELVPAFIVSLLMTIGISLIGKKPPA